MRRLPASLLLFVLLACGSNKASGAVALAAYGMLGSAVSRAQGGCYAACDARQACNPQSGLCEDNPCGLGCGSGRRCDLHAPVPRCVEDPVSADLVRSPSAPPALPVATPQP